MPINFDNIKTTRNREYKSDDIQKVYDDLWYMTPEQRAAVIGSVIEESGGNPLAVDETGKYRGLLQWSADRYVPMSGDKGIERYNQLRKLRETIDNTTDGKSWTHGGKGSGYRTNKEAYNDFNNPDSPVEKTLRGFSFGYVRPTGKGDSYNNRLNVARQLYDRIKGDNTVKIKDNRLVIDWQKTRPAKMFGTKFADGGDLNSMNDYLQQGNAYPQAEEEQAETSQTPKKWDQLSISEKDEIIQVGVQNGLRSIDEIKTAYDNYVDELLAEQQNDYLSAQGSLYTQEQSEDDGDVYGDVLQPSVDDSMLYNSGEGDIQYQGEPNSYARGGRLFAPGGTTTQYTPPQYLRNDIARWEGSSMKENRPFEAEAADFNRVIPQNVRDRLSQNELDALYSYGYNVGMGNLKKRVLPTLENYVNGRVSDQAVANSMWATLDPQMRGLQRRRAWERSMFTGQPYSSPANGIAYNPTNPGSNTQAYYQAVSQPFQFQEPIEPIEQEKPWFEIQAEKNARNTLLTPELEDTIENTVKPEDLNIAQTPRKKELTMLDLYNFLGDMFGEEDSEDSEATDSEYDDYSFLMSNPYHNSFARGGHIYDGDSEDSQQMAITGFNNGNLSREMSENADMQSVPLTDEWGLPKREIVLNPVSIHVHRDGTSAEPNKRPIPIPTYNRLFTPNWHILTPQEREAARQQQLNNWTSGVRQDKGIQPLGLNDPAFIVATGLTGLATGATKSALSGVKNLFSGSAKALSDYVATHPIAQYGLVGLDAVAGAEGIERANNGQVDAQTALDLGGLAAPAYGLMKNGTEVANEGQRLALNIKNHPKWFRNAMLDNTVPYRHRATVLAKKRGYYINDFSSLRRNTERLHSALQEGANSTINDYVDLTGIKIPSGKISLVSWEKIPKDAAAYSDEKRIFSPITLAKHTNIANSTAELKSIGAHEQTHISNKFLNKTYNTPNLGVFDNDMGYFIPNVNHPISKKYASEFMKYGIKNKHSVYPEETWANFMEERSKGLPINSAFENLDGVENIPRSLAEPFINDYIRYLSSTYYPLSK